MARRLVPLVLLALVAAGCAGSGAPQTFAEQTGPLDAEIAEALPADLDLDTEAMPLVQRNFLEGCLTGGRDGLDPELVDVEAEGLARVCVCTYDGYVDYFTEAARNDLGATGEEITDDTVARRAYDLFDEIDEELSNGDATIADVSAELNQIVVDCITSESGAVG